MEFTRLSEVAVVETANDEDKVLIEQNGEIKRVPKTQVGGGAGKCLVIIDSNWSREEPDFGNISYSTNMTLEEAVNALNNAELTGAMIYTNDGLRASVCGFITDETSNYGETALRIIPASNFSMSYYWNERGINVLYND